MITVNSNIMITIITIDMFVVVHMLIIIIIISSSNVIVLRDCKDRRRGRAEQSGAHGSGHDPNSLPITTVIISNNVNTTKHITYTYLTNINTI